MTRRAEEIEERFFEVYSKLAETRDEVYTVWEAVETLKSQVQTLMRKQANSQNRRKPNTKRRQRGSRK